MVNIKKKRGFTLVELIVVLVILAILAALLVPALTGYIDKARKRQVIAETRMITMAIQTKMSEYYASSEWNGYGVDNGLSAVDFDKYYVAYKSGSNANKVNRFSEITSLAEVTTLGNGGSFGACVAEDGRVTVVVYKDGKGNVGIYFYDTQEYVAYRESDFSNLEAYYGAIKDRVYYSPYYEDKGKTHINPLNVKVNILEMMGYNGT